MVGDTGIEPVTPSMSTKCSPAELIAHPLQGARVLALSRARRKACLRIDFSAGCGGFGWVRGVGTQIADF
jgi:hypothetical protein